MKHFINIHHTNFKRVATLGFGGVLALALLLGVGLSNPVSADDCVRNAPVVTFNSPASQTGDAGSTVVYDINVKNDDSATCAASNVNINNTNALPSEWVATFDTSATTLLPGESHNYSISVDSSTGSFNGDYTLPFGATQAYGIDDPEQLSGMVTPFDLTYTVTNGNVYDVTAPVVNITTPANGSQVVKGSLTPITVTATDNVGVTAVFFYVNGQQICSGTSLSCAWQVPAKKGKICNITVRAYDAAGLVGTATATVTAN